MENKYLKYQFAIFGDFLSIKFEDKEHDSFFLEFVEYGFKKIATNEQKFQNEIIYNRPVYLSRDGDVQVEFRTERIDIIILNKVEKNKIINKKFSDVYNIFNKVSKSLMKIFNITAHRFAFVITANITTNINLVNVRSLIPYYTNDLHEFLLRLNERKQYMINSHREVLNVITTLQDTVNYSRSPIINKGYILIVDINTAQENMLKRFDVNDLNRFLVISKEVYDDIYDNFKN